MLGQVEVKLGAAKREGGSRGKQSIIGGESTHAFRMFEKPILHPPEVAMDILDTEVPLPRAMKMHVEEVMEDPAVSLVSRNI